MTRIPARSVTSMAVSLIVIGSVIAGGLGGMGVVTASPYDGGLTDIKVVDRVDKDGDGYVSSFGIAVEVDTSIRENGKDYEGKVFQSKGHPKLVYAAKVSDYDGATVGSPVNERYDGFAMRVIEPGYGVEVVGGTAMSLSDMRGERHGENFRFKGEDLEEPYRTLYQGREITEIAVVYFESDSTPHDYNVRKDEWVDTMALPLSEPIKMERPATDSTGTVEVRSNVDGATVYVDGSEVGTTPWSGTFPVDSGERAGQTTIRVEKDGYITEEKHLSLSPPQTVRFDLQRVKKPLIVDSEPDGATVTIDGTVVGTTPGPRSDG